MSRRPYWRRSFVEGAMVRNCRATPNVPHATSPHAYCFKGVVKPTKTADNALHWDATKIVLCVWGGCAQFRNHLVIHLRLRQQQSCSIEAVAAYGAPQSQGSAIAACDSDTVLLAQEHRPRVKNLPGSD